jgi:microcystin-dependent protein
MMPGTGNVDGLGVEWGVSAVQLTIGQLPNHDHDFAEVGHTHPPNGAAVFQGSNAGGSTGFEVDIAGQTRVQMTTTGSALSGITFHAQGSNLYHENVHPVLGVNILIFAGV